MRCLGRVIASGALVAVAACSPNSAPSTTQHSAFPARTAIGVTKSGWQLPAPVSRLVALPDGPGAVVLAGGLSATNASSTDVRRLDLTTGTVQPVGNLARAVHDAAGALVGTTAVVFGGGSATVDGAVQEAGTGVVAQLPQPRADLTAVTLGGRTFLVGGYDGRHELPAVLATTDGKTFQPVASLATTVRYAAVGSAGHDLFVFGGSHRGTPIRMIQRVDPATGQTSIAGTLPMALSDAVALTVGGHLLIAGGRTSGGAVSGNVFEFDPGAGTTRLVAQLAVPVADAAAAVVGGRGYLFGGERGSPTGHPVAAVQIISAVTVAAPAPNPATSGAAAASLPLSDSHPFNGRLLIADRGNNRLLLVNAAKQILWTFPNPSAPAPPTGFYFPDDAFFIHHGTGIISNQEGNNTVVEIGFPSGAPLWSYGHPRVAKPAAGFLHEPDDAYLLRNGNVVVADANNCRVVFISPAAKQIGQIGRTGSCVHAPPSSLGYPNGDTPLSNGNVLISEVYGSWISEYTVAGKLVWTVHLPISYPSDPQQLGPNRYLVADYAKPGGIYEFTRKGRIVWSYHPTSGASMLNHPSLAEQLPGGFICANDDYRNRVVIIDPRTNRIVWQYGQTNVRGSQPGFLSIPDGFDLLAPDGTTPTHPDTG